jgi:hypothetical protein
MLDDAKLDDVVYKLEMDAILKNLKSIDDINDKGIDEDFFKNIPNQPMPSPGCYSATMETEYCCWDLINPQLMRDDCGAPILLEPPREFLIDEIEQEKRSPKRFNHCMPRYKLEDRQIDVGSARQILAMQDFLNGIVKHRHGGK